LPLIFKKRKGEAFFLI